MKDLYPVNDKGMIEVSEHWVGRLRIFKDSRGNIILLNNKEYDQLLKEMENKHE